jgi:hypothetical protein
MKKTLIYYLFIFIFLPVRAQDISVEAEYPSVVKAGQQFSIIWTVNTNGGEFSAPSFNGFYKLMGPQTSFSSSTQMINGRVSQKTTNSYVYYLQALSEGKYVLSPASYRLKNKTYYSDSLHIDVIADNAQQNNQQGAGGNVQKNTEVEPAGRDIFVDLSLSRRDVYLGEGIVATVKIYTRVDLAGINEIKYPPFTGFLKSDLDTPPLNSLRQENVNGTIYGTGVIQQFLLYPQVTGEITIDPVQITVLVQQKTGHSDPFFGDFFSSYQSVPKAVVSKAVTINVKPLPGVRPDDFSGVVGKLDLKASVSKDTVNVNDAVDFTVVISGSGNLRLAETPSLKLSPDIEVYDPKITENLKNSTNGTTGQKTFDFLMIPRHYGDFKIPAFTYSFFNTATGKYERLSTREYHFYARKGNEQNAGITVYGGISKEDVKYVGKDIRFIKSSPGRLRKSTGAILSDRLFYMGYAASLFLFLLFLFIRREHIRRNADMIAVKNRKAAKIAGKRLKDASGCLKRGENDRFYEEILKGLWGYLSDKLNIPVSVLTRNNAVTALKAKGIGEEEIKNLTDILDTCEYARYSPSGSGSEATQIYEVASRFIKSLENSIG